MLKLNNYIQFLSKPDISATFSQVTAVNYVVLTRSNYATTSNEECHSFLTTSTTLSSYLLMSVLWFGNLRRACKMK